MIRPILLTWAALLSAATVQAQSTGDYRSAQSGGWNVASTWQRFDGTSFIAAPAPPAASDGQVEIRAGHTVTASTTVSIDQVVVTAGGTLVTSGGTFTLQNGPGVDLSVNGTWLLSGATMEGPGTIILANSGTLSWTSGILAATSDLTINAGSTVTANGGAATLQALGTINNSGTWNMEGGNLGQAGFGAFPCVFLNLPGGVVNLNAWASNTNSWHLETNNQGTFNMGNGGPSFTFSNDFSGKSFTNTSNGVVNVPSGELVFACTVTNSGSLVAGPGARFIHNGGGAGFTNTNGGTISGEFEQAGGTLFVTGSLVLNTFFLTGGAVEGPAAITLTNFGTLFWTNGELKGSSILNLPPNALASVSGTGTRVALGTINNEGTWNMQGGNLGQANFASGPCTFNNLPGGVVELNNWESNTNTWHQVTNNQGVINKYNGNVPFSFSNDFSGKAFNNLGGGTLNVSSGECVFRVPTTNNASITGGPGSQVTLDGNATGGFFTNAAGGTVNTALHVVSGHLNVEAALTVTSFTLFGAGVLNGPQALTIAGGGGTANLNGGVLSAGSTLNITVGATVVHNSVGTLAAQGTINNGGIWNMQNGSIGQPNFVSGPFAFNNLATGVVNLNGWDSNTNTWHMVTTNQGSFNKNNGSTPFTFSDDFSGKSFTNAAGAVFNVNSGTVTFNLPLPLQNGTFNVVGGATMVANNAMNFAGPAIENNGTINGPLLRYQGSSAQQLNGAGSVANLAIDNAAGVDLGGDQTVTNGLTMTNGQLRLGANDLFVENNAPGAVSGGNASSWVVNNGTGSLHRQVNGSNYLYPVGTGSYTPLTLSMTNGPQDRFSVRVNDGLSMDYNAPGEASGTIIVDHAVDRTWVVAEDVSGGNTADVTLQWGTADELPLFNGSLCAVSRFDGTVWEPGIFAPASGQNPFTRSLSGVSAFREFGVVDDLLNLSTSLTGPDASVNNAPKLFPQPASTVLHVVAAEGLPLSDVTLLEASGRIALRAPSNSTDRVVLDVSSMVPGLYVLEWSDGVHGVTRTRVVIAR